MKIQSTIRSQARIALLACLFAAGCHAPGPVAPPADGVVLWIGEQRKAVHDGDVSAKVRLAELARRPHLYGIGPLEGLTGEITVVDGRATISTVQGSTFRTHASLDHGAAFFVWTHAADWKSVPLPNSVRTLEQLEAYLPEAARSAGLDDSAPMAFRVEGEVQSLAYHVLSPPEHTPPTFADHEKSKIRSSLAAQTVRMVGFHSTEHRGIFTPGASDVHVHFVTADERFAGHVEGFTLAPGATLLLGVPKR